MGTESEAAALAGGAPLAFRRVLVPLRIREDFSGEIRPLDIAMLSALRGDPPAVTLFTVVKADERREAMRYLTEVAQQLPPNIEVTKRVATGDPVAAIVTEAEKDYDLIALGAPERSSESEHLFEATVDEVVRLAPCPSMIFSSRLGHWPPNRIMVPTGGSAAANRAADLAFSLSEETGQVLLFHVIDPESATLTATSHHSSAPVRLGMGYDVVDGLRKVGEGAGIAVVSEVVMGDGAVTSIVDRASHDVDLLILGTNLRAGSPRLYLGPKVDRLLEEVPCSIIIFNS